MDKLLRGGVRLIDHLLSASLRIIVISQDPQCIFRIQLAQAVHSVIVDSQHILKGDSVVVLHLWNERMPILPASGADLEWALQLRRKLIYSFRLIASFMQNNSQFSTVRAIYGASAVLSFTDHTGGTRLMQHLGFSVLPYQRPFGKFGEFWENLFSWWLMWTYNEASLQSRKFQHLQRTELWMTTEDFLQHYGQSTGK